MTAKDAIIFADKICWGYNKKSKNLSYINDTLMINLGEEKYEQFCEKINSDPRTIVLKAHQENFLPTAINIPSDAISDFSVHTNWTLRKILTIISEIV